MNEKEDPTSPFKCVLLWKWAIADSRFCVCKVCAKVFERCD
jgi:hypothetical protein